jgi:hypothetical protein
MTVQRFKGVIAQTAPGDVSNPPIKPSNRLTLKPCATPAPAANSMHPSPSARPFRLPFNGLVRCELRRIFCSCRQLRGTFAHAGQAGGISAASCSERANGLSSIIQTAGWSFSQMT